MFLNQMYVSECKNLNHSGKPEPYMWFRFSNRTHASMVTSNARRMNFKMAHV